ncbi:LLM class flavin-dependent oxidoreductase [Pseudonocardia sp. ICBG601]|uniref:LLM class flavin-dependent oxidoreductase n=1 Tax=Pseudonocardia sp. ICBG601 TaxID=2846759 RepID=UPI001CF6844A|nr:LLM class flavin-dependent oxidoreductase [Pseudonocardia sp. ICBG601]
MNAPATSSTASGPRTAAPAGGPRPVTGLGFNTRVSWSDDHGPAAGLAEGIALYRAAEDLGYDTGWAYQRHFDHYLSSPLPFFAAVGQHTSRIRLGSAVLPMRYQDPVLLAEAAGTTDLLVGGRLELALATGSQASWDAVFGGVDTDPRTEALRRLDRFLAGVSGEALHVVDGPGQGAPVGTPIRVTPHSPGLRGRLRIGAASTDSARRAARLGLGLITGTVLHGLAEGETFAQYQARVIAAYRDTWYEVRGSTPPPVAVAASILPGTTAALRETYAAYDHQRRTEGMAASRPRGALEPVVGAQLPAGQRISPVHHGTPDEVAASVLADPGIAAADEVVLFLPPGFGPGANVRLLTDLAAVAPAWGWSPA